MTAKPRIIRDYGDTDYVTGLRAIAATMVVIIHTGAFNEFGMLGRAFTGAGKYGVDIFFVISGFTIAKTFTDATSYHSYLTRRLFRIVPLYWLVITVAMAMWLSGLFPYPEWMVHFDVLPDLYNYFMHLSMFSFLDYRVANSLLGVEWTIPVEVFWYVFLPLLLVTCKTVLRVFGAAVAVLVLTAVLSYASKKLIGTSIPVKWTPIAHGHLFLLGAASYYLRTRHKLDASRRPKFWIACAAVMFLVAVSVDFSGRSEVLALSTAILIVFVTPARAPWLSKPLTTRPMLFVGSVSYSIYLLHMLVIPFVAEFGVLPTAGLAKFLVVYSLTLGLSAVTYVLVEKPTNNLGRHLARRF